MCNGQPTTLVQVHHDNPTADLIAALQIPGGGAAKLVSITAYEPGTTNVVASATTTFRRPPNVECTGTATEDGQTFDFVAEFVIHRPRSSRQCR